MRVPPVVQSGERDCGHATRLKTAIPGKASGNVPLVRRVCPIRRSLCPAKRALDLDRVAFQNDARDVGSSHEPVKAVSVDPVRAKQFDNPNARALAARAGVFSNVA